MKTALITGASRGIGSECAKKLAAEGFNVAVNYNASMEEANTLVRVIRSDGHNAIAVKADVSSRRETEFMFREIKRVFGGVDVLVNNAGIAQIKLFTDVTEYDYERMLGVNLKSAFNCSQLAAEHMISKKWGRIINISSVWGLVGASCEVTYSASKAALIGFTKSLARELAPSGITVNAIAPGLIATDMNASLSEAELQSLKDEIPAGRMGKPSEIAALAAFLTGESASYITAQVIAVDGGWK